MTNARYWLASASIGTMLFAASAVQAQTAAPAAEAAAESEIVVTAARSAKRSMRSATCR